MKKDYIRNKFEKQSSLWKNLSAKKLNHKSVGYKNFFKIIKIVLTLSVTQAQCERTFNILKYIKNHLRNRLSDDHVDALISMNRNKDFLMVIDNEVVIKEI